MSSLISADGAIMGGEPVIKGTRVPIQRLIFFAEQGNLSSQFLQQEYPHIPKNTLNSVISLLIQEGVREINETFKKQKTL